MAAIFFGSIGSLADTSELQREAFNAAFAEHGLDWDWSRDEYRDLLRESGGEARVAAYARARGEDVDAAAVHATKSQKFQERLRDGGISPRAGVSDAIAHANEEGVPVSLVTTTSRENIAALADALRPEVDIDAFAFVIDSTAVGAGKPAPDVYAHALERAGQPAASVVAIEDNAGGVRSAIDAGIAVVAFPGENNVGHNFSGAAAEVSELDYGRLRELTGGN